MTADPTDADRVTGQALAGHRGRYMPEQGIGGAPAVRWEPCREVGCDAVCGGDIRAEAIAQALADERRRALHEAADNLRDLAGRLEAGR